MTGDRLGPFLLGMLVGGLCAIGGGVLGVLTGSRRG